MIMEQTDCRSGFIRDYCIVASNPAAIGQVLAGPAPARMLAHADWPSLGARSAVPDRLRSRKDLPDSGLD
jgi:hypothetical protein